MDHVHDGFCPQVNTKREKKVEQCSRKVWMRSTLLACLTLYTLLSVHRLERSQLQSWTSLIDSGQSVLPVLSYEAANLTVSMITNETSERRNATAVSSSPLLSREERKIRRANRGDRVKTNEEQFFSNQTTRHTITKSFNENKLEEQNRDITLDNRKRPVRPGNWRKRAESFSFIYDLPLNRNNKNEVDNEIDFEQNITLTPEQERRRPSKPLCPLCRKLIARAQLVNLTYQNVTDSSSIHQQILPHRRAYDTNGTLGFVHDETALRRNPPLQINYTKEQIKVACSKHDSTFTMITKKIKVVTDEDLENQRRQLQSKGARHRPETIFCMIYTVSTYEDRLERIRETWGPKCDGFMAASNRTDPRINTVHILHNGVEVYRNMWQKSRAMWSYAYDNYYDKYDWFHIGGDDMFLIVENLRYYLESEEIKTAANDGVILPDGSESQQRPLFLGCRHRRSLPYNELFNSGGAGYTLNKAALKLLVVDGLPNYATNLITPEEDVMVALAFHRFNVFPYETKDETKAERYNALAPDELYNGTYKEHGWIRRMGIDLKPGLDGSATHSVSYHYIKGDEIYRLHALLYNLCPSDALNSTMSTISRI